MEGLSDSGDDEEGMAPVRSNDNEDPSRHTCTSTGVSCSSTQAEVAVPEEASDNRHCVDTDCKIAKPPAQPSETNAESQKEDTKTEHIRAAVANTKDQREDFQEKDGMTETVTRGEEDNKATEEETIRKVGILNIKSRLSNCLYLNMTFKFSHQFLIREVYFTEN